MNKFLETAKELQVQGLQSNHEDGIDFTHTDDELKFRNLETDYAEIQEHENVLDSTDTSEKTEVSIDFREVDKAFVKTNIQIEEMIEKNGGMWKCKVCGKICERKDTIKRHAETHIKGLSHKCHLCSRTLSTRDSLKKHIGDYHCKLEFTCDACGNEGMKKQAFKNHKNKYHKTSV